MAPSHSSGAGSKNGAVRRPSPLAEETNGDIDYPFEDTSGVGDENKMRGNWTSQLDFVLSCIGFTVGLGNVWRFPYYCYLHGGGAFLIPYLVMLVFAGLPILFMELAIGQFASLGCVSVWKVCPLFKGIGIAMFVVSCFIAIYYNVITAWSIYYLIASCSASVPWASCEHDWNTANCASYTHDQLQRCAAVNGSILRNGSCVDAPPLAANGSADERSLFALLPVNRTLPSDEFFHIHVLHLAQVNGFGDVGTIHWQLALYLLVAWLIVFFCLFKGIKTSGKVVYLTTVAPYVILLVLLVRAVTQPGALNGLAHYFTPRWQRLYDPKVWGDAATQMFFSLSTCWGGLITLSSYNRFHNRCYRDVWVVGLADAFTSVLAGAVTFATLGLLAHELGKRDLFDVTVEGVGLAFVVYAEALARLPVAPLWAILWFTLLIMLGIDTQFFVVETVVTAICDEFPERLRKNHRHVLSFMSLFFYCCGVALCTGAGMYYVQLLDHFAPTWSLLIIAFFECMALAWVYGVDNFLDNIKWMVRSYPWPYIYWKVTWKFITPLLMMATLIFNWVEYRPLSYGDYVFPQWANALGWAVSLVSVAAIPAAALYSLCTARGGLLRRLTTLMTPEGDWGPALAVHRAEYFPLQIPEAKLPMRALSAGPRASASTQGASEDDGDDAAAVDEPHRPLNAVRFDRETAI